MANVKISALPTYTGSPADLRWFVMNNSGETETYKYSGYSTSITYGTGTDSIKSTNATGAAGTNSIAIGKDTNAGGNGSVNIGNSYGTPIGTNSINIGNNPGLNSSPNQITIGSGAYNNNDLGIAIGHSTSSQQGGICIGSSTTRATGSNSVSLGNAIEQNLGDYSIIIGYNNSAYAPFNGNPYGVVIGSGHRVDNTGRYNTILGGANTTISGASNSFIGNGVGLTSVRTGDVIINSSGNTITGTGEYKISIGGFGNTISSSGNFNTIVGGQNNLLDATSFSQILGGSNNTINCETSSVERFNTIINGSGNTIFDAADDQTLQTIINSVDTTLQNGTQRVTAIGLSGRTINDASAGITYVETLKAFRQVVEGFYDNGTMTSGAGPALTINLNNGSKQSITITGGTNFIYFTGSIPGGRLVLKITNTGTGSINWSDNAPYNWVLPATTPSSQPTSSATDIFVFESFDTAALFLTTHSENLS